MTGFSNLYFTELRFKDGAASTENVESIMRSGVCVSECPTGD